MNAPVAGAADWIVAAATPPGAGERAVVRGSGPGADAALAAAWRDAAGAPFVIGRPRGVAAGSFHDGVGAVPAHLWWMPGPRSFTREDVFELHLPGSPFLVARALERLVALGARPAQPGEFTRRAFHSGRLDLTRAEGVLALVEARTGAERRAAAALLAGGLGERVEELRALLDDARALAEASLDFDEGDTGHVGVDELAAAAERARAALALTRTSQGRRAASARSGAARVVLAGAANAGKSTLFNALRAGDAPAALVSPESGTTRDVLRAPWPLAPGVDVELHDTAGIESDVSLADPAGELARAAEDAARAAHAGADCLLWVVDAVAPGALGERPAADAATPTVLVWNQVDRRGAAAPPSAAERGVAAVVACSALHGTGLAELARVTAAALGLSGDGESAGSGVGRELAARHERGLAAAAAALAGALDALRAGAPLELFAEGLRAASLALDELSGRTTPEALLDRIFARFCLGK